MLVRLGHQVSSMVSQTDQVKRRLNLEVLSYEVRHFPAHTNRRPAHHSDCVMGCETAGSKLL